MALDLPTRFRQQPERRRNNTSGGQVGFDLKTAAVTFAENCQIVVGDSEYFAQDTDDLVSIPRIDHDRAERGQPGIGRIVALQVAFGLDGNRQTCTSEGCGHRSEPELSRTK